MEAQEARGRGPRGATTVRPYQIRGRFLTAIALRLEGPADQRMMADLDAQIRQTPQFFADAPMVLDLELAAGAVTPEDLASLVEHLRFRRISVFAVQGGTREQKAAAATLGLISIPAGRDAPARGADREEAPAPAATPAPTGPVNRLVTSPVRSGQTIMAEKGDLIVVGTVGSGAELIAAGNIHVYGQLRGRASAGVFGDETARIFCQSLDAELLSIAGLYHTSESLDPLVRRLSVQVLLRGDRLCVEPFGQPQPRDRSGQ
ncbi:Septum site-determining protein MinC [Rubellimicrobium mesophilum DSM 19309]|uniref:Probable septum site-determining protein MinC n=1 Tax=Rubellimicrobium mesophilum DSM 19309 TaxID=442562 RepID=A0A017HGG2_9RHOB|nr:septum site-determining protein MinC [Rubellimicrobium mesophilum]EYD72894.1 Septum site-determining protein MinC [Rubellimicrobium mesophilum DSM 19309]